MSKVDRSGAILSREMEVKEVKKGTKEAAVHLAYAISIKEHMMLEKQLT